MSEIKDRKINIIDGLMFYDNGQIVDGRNIYVGCHKALKKLNYEYCSKKCARKYKENQCIGCKINQKASGYEYCSETCAKEYQQTRQQKISENEEKIKFIEGLMYYENGEKVDGRQICIYCTKKLKRIDNSFCSDKCWEEHEKNKCNGCQYNKKNLGYDYCSRECGKIHKSNEKLMLEMQKNKK